jgi:hypothetical protein
MGMVTDTSTVEISFLGREEVVGSIGKIDSGKGDEGREWVKLEDVVIPLENDPAPVSPVVCNEQITTLGVFVSSPNRYRWFCIRCGTPLAYSIPLSAQPPFWRSMNPPPPRMFDIWLGTCDRDVLDNEWMRPEKVVWTHFGIEWVKEMSKDGLGDVDRHPLPFIDQHENDEDGVKTWLKLLGKD